jgi:hypothetical protein
MSDAPWLRELAQVNREREAEERSRLDERWDRLSAGELTPEEEAELKALAETSEEAREAYEAFRPLGPDFQARVVSAVRAQEPQARVLPFRRAARRYGGWLMAAVAAAALFLFVRNPASMPPLPAYKARLSDGAREYRGAAEPSAGPSVFFPGTQLTLEVTPEQAVTGPLEAHAFLARGTDILPWEPEPPLDLSPQGAVRLRGRLGEEIRLPPGEWKIWVVIGRPGKLPPTDEIMAGLRAGRTRHPDWQAAASEGLRIADRASP